MRNSKIKIVCGAFCLNVGIAHALSIRSDALQPQTQIKETNVFNSFGCSGKNISPDLSWSDAPKDTKAFAVTMYDPDAPTGSGWWHWVLFNIPANATKIPAGASEGKQSKLPAGTIQGRTDFGFSAYGGPCPPSGAGPHRYIFKVFALKDKLPLDKDAGGAMVGFYIGNLKLAEATLEAKYER